MGETRPPPSILLSLLANGSTVKTNSPQAWCAHGNCYPCTQDEVKAQKGLVICQGHTADRGGVRAYNEVFWAFELMPSPGNLPPPATVRFCLPGTSLPHPLSTKTSASQGRGDTQWGSGDTANTAGTLK